VPSGVRLMPAGASGWGPAIVDAWGEAGSPACGDLVTVQVRVSGGRVTDAGYRAQGCRATHDAADAACAALRGATLDQALQVSEASIARDLGQAPVGDGHAAGMVADAVAEAFEQWFGARLGTSGPPPRPGRVAVAMSGGVDSAVAALLLSQQGHDVVGVTMRLWHDPVASPARRSCCAPETVRMARDTCAAIGIPHLTIDAADRFRREVVEEFARGYAEGRTPNPCITCNGEVRFRILSEAAALLGAHHLASGHYARTGTVPARGQSQPGDSPGPGTVPVVARSADFAKDQSYMLARLEPGILERLLLPLGGMTKDEVRAIAVRHGLPAADAVESQDVCFVGEGGYGPFLERHAGLGARPGRIVDQHGAVLGMHDGHWRYTVGQRRGLGVAAREPLYVLATDARRNEVVVGPRAALGRQRIELAAMVVHAAPDHALDVRIRHHGRLLRGHLLITGDATGEVVLEDAAEAVAPGQTAALYDEGRLVAAGTITRAHPARIGTED